ncbi:MAG TPA: maleylpyruvate isomerase N-terminal domain-containing protein [Streptosporangiaceae bacterium]|nr:maleylpyruvate isomerase N-terminal domain-containing protein [Streptosporangiaceae bacterium]
MTELPSWETLTGWAAAGQAQVERAAGGLDPARLAGPSRLPGWTRGHVLSHLARNADALVNLLTWARTGTEARMYASPADRADGIEAGAGRALPEQLADLTAAGQRFAAAAAAVPLGRRDFTVLSGQGREIPASEVPWLRVREVWLHLVDLDAGDGIDAIPADVGWTLAADVAGWMSDRTEATADLKTEGRGAIRLGPAGGPAGAVVAGSPQRIAGWLTGRSGGDGLAVTAGELPDLPRWL